MGRETKGREIDWGGQWERREIRGERRDTRLETRQDKGQPKQSECPANLFFILPFHNDSINNNNNNNSSSNISNSSSNNINNNSANNPTNDEIELRPNAKILFIPGGVSYKLKRALQRAGCNTYITAGRKLQSVLCSKNKTQPDCMENKGVYKYEV